MLDRVIALSIRGRGVVLFATLLLIALGLRAALTLPVDAVPDLTNTQVQVLTDATALGSIDVERLVTAPIERVMAGLPLLTEVRSLSRAGASAVTLVFEEGTDPMLARSLVSERMPLARQSVRAGYGVPELGPMSTGLGEIYHFEVRDPERSAMELRTILDWQVIPRLRLVPGVAEVNVFGGEMQTYEVAPDPQRMAALDVSLEDVVTALERDNRVAGGGTLQRGAEGLVVRAEGLVGSLADLRRIVVRPDPRAPVLMDHVAAVRIAPMPRWGAATRDARGEIVAGVAMMRIGENSRAVSHAVDAAVREIGRTLPRGVRIDTFYDRTTMVDRTLRTVEHNLLEGGLLVVVVLFLLLRNLRAGLMVASTIPLAMLGAVIGMKALGVSGNLMSLGAIDFGLVVDGAIILIENAVHHVSTERARLGRRLTPAERDAVVLGAAREVRSATAFGELIVAMVYAPILALHGVEGKMFHPMAFTVLLALGTAFVLSLTFVPAIASVALSLDLADLPSPLIVVATRAYRAVLVPTLRHPRAVAAVAAASLVATVFVGNRLGTEFVPDLDEGSLVIEVIRPPSTSLQESVRQTGQIEAVLQRFAEVRTVVSRTGRPEIANDPMGPDQSDIYVMLRPRETWAAPRERTALMTRMSEALHREVPGIGFGFSQPIQMRTNELVSGIRADFAVKLYGDDLRTLARVGAALAHRLSAERGAVDVRVDRVEGLPVLRVVLDRDAIARRGISAERVLRTVDAIGGITVGEIVDGARRIPWRVRLDDEARADAEAIRRTPLRNDAGALFPLAEVAVVEVVEEPAQIGREAGQRRLMVQCNVRGRDVGGFADEALSVLPVAVPLPEGYRMEFGGQFEHLRSARLRLAVVVPLALALIFWMLRWTFGAARPALLVFANVPFATVGGVAALALRGLPFSISAAVGFVALSGVAVLNGLVLVAQIRALEAAGAPTSTAVLDGALRRLRPVLTTALVASLGFVPMAFSTSDGAEVQRPLATVVIGGLVTSTALTLLVLPAIYAWLLRRTDAGADPSTPVGPLGHTEA